MQFIKRFGKQLGFVTLVGFGMFSVSLVTAQEDQETQETTISINTDVFIDSALLQGKFPNSTELELIKIGGIHFSKRSEFDIESTLTRNLCDPFGNCNPYLNNQNVNGSDFSVSVGSTGNVNSRIDAIFTKKVSNPQFKFGLFSTAPNPPALSQGNSTNYGTCNFKSCVVFHYGYNIDVTSYGVLDPKFIQSYYCARSLEDEREFCSRDLLASPEIDPNPPGSNFIPQNTPVEYLVVYSEQRNPRKTGVVLVNWAEFPVKSGQTPTLRFTNNKLNSGSITIANTRVLRSATQIPLQQLTATGLPPTDPRFVPVPSADGTVAPGETKPPVPVTDIIGVLDRIATFNGTSDFVEIPNKDNLNFGTGDLSISAWVKTTSTNGIEVILDKRVEATGPVQGYSLANYSGSLLLQLADGQGNQFTNYVSNILIADGNLHHVAVTVDRDQPDGGRWYIDGIEVVGERFNPTRRGSLSNSKPLVIGRRSDSPNSPGFFNGEIGYVRLAGRVLSSQEIQAIAANKP